MKKNPALVVTLFAVVVAIFTTSGCQSAPDQPAALVGAWRGKAQFTSGPYAEVKDLDFMYAFHADGTMTESSNYDGAPPVPPAYGAWKQTGPRQFEARYEFYSVKPPASLDEIAKSGWGPDGRGVLTQKITLSADGNAFESTLKLEMFDKQGKPAGGGGDATASAQRIRP